MNVCGSLIDMMLRVTAVAAGMRARVFIGGGGGVLCCYELYFHVHPQS